jgi:hypothetical protein
MLPPRLPKPPPPRPPERDADARLRDDARGPDGGIRKKLTTGLDHGKADDRTQRTGPSDFILCRDR